MNEGIIFEEPFAVIYYDGNTFKLLYVTFEKIIVVNITV